MDAPARSTPERVLRGIGVLHGTLLVVGEMLRSWGQGRPLAFVLDDVWIGGGVIAASLWFRAGDLHRRAALAAAWGANVGGLYPSFFGKLLAPPGADFHTNYSADLLTALIGLALFGSLGCMVATIVLKPPART
jgi:hypothetical protein